MPILVHIGVECESQHHDPLGPSSSQASGLKPLSITGFMESVCIEKGADIEVINGEFDKLFAHLFK
jgi:hypothetical protein